MGWGPPVSSLSHLIAVPKNEGFNGAYIHPLASDYQRSMLTPFVSQQGPGGSVLLVSLLSVPREMT